MGPVTAVSAFIFTSATFYYRNIGKRVNRTKFGKNICGPSSSTPTGCRRVPKTVAAAAVTVVTVVITVTIIYYYHREYPKLSTITIIITTLITSITAMIMILMMMMMMMMMIQTVNPTIEIK